jgi:hypothetical protein
MKYLMPMARCQTTGQTVKGNYLASKFTQSQRQDAQRAAETLAKDMQFKTGRNWQAFVESYTVDSQGRTKL